jgi:tRNA(Ile)-lysidine synthase
MAASADGHGRIQTPGLDVFRSFDWLRIARPGGETLENRNYRLPAPAPGSVRLPGGAAIRLELVEKPETWETSGYVYNSEMGCVDWDRVTGLLEVRNWRPGDRYQPIGSSGEEKLKTLFHEARIPLWERRHWPVLTDGSGILWSRKFGPAADRSAGPHTRLILAIRETEEPR